jgi:ferredoxin-NADP reductase
LNWQLGAVIELAPETDRVSSITLGAPDWKGHRAGQHLDVRLTAQDGYEAQRSYSLASAPEDDHLVLTVERLDDGEVSPYLVDQLRPGDQLEFRGPVGGYFVWDEALAGPVLLVAGGSGIAPFRAMLRHHAATQSDVPVRVLYSARSLDDVIYHDELMRLAIDDEADIHLTLTRTWAEGWTGHRGRINQRLLAEIMWPPERRPLNFVCGPSGFVETAANALVASGHPPGRIKTERFGPSG